MLQVLLLSSSFWLNGIYFKIFLLSLDYYYFWDFNMQDHHIFKFANSSIKCCKLREWTEWEVWLILFWWDGLVTQDAFLSYSHLWHHCHWKWFLVFCSTWCGKRTWDQLQMHLCLSNHFAYKSFVTCTT